MFRPVDVGRGSLHPDRMTLVVGTRSSYTMNVIHQFPLNSSCMEGRKCSIVGRSRSSPRPKARPFSLPLGLFHSCSILPRVTEIESLLSFAGGGFTLRRSKWLASTRSTNWYLAGGNKLLPRRDPGPEPMQWSRVAPESSGQGSGPSHQSLWFCGTSRAVNGASGYKNLLGIAT